MTRHKMKRPASRARCRPRDDLNKLTTTASSPTNISAATKSQASCHVDDRGEDDFVYFTRHPGASHRFRLPVDDEFPDEVMREARIQARGREVLVLVAIDRNASGQPTTRARGLVCIPHGGTA